MEALERQDRREVVRLLKVDREHPDAEVRKVAYAWAHSSRWDSWTYRVPGWLVPWVGLLLLAVGLELGQVVASAIGLLVTGWGLLRWNNQACARAIRRVYSPPR